MSKGKSKGVSRGKRKKKPIGGWILLTILTTVNLLISIMLRLSDRKMAIQAIQQDEKLSLLYTGEKTTKSL